VKSYSHLVQRKKRSEDIKQAQGYQYAVQLPAPTTNQEFIPDMIRHELKFREMVRKRYCEIVNEIKQKKDCHEPGVTDYFPPSNDQQDQEYDNTYQEQS